MRQLDLERVDLAISRTTLGKAHLREHTVAQRVAAIERAAASRPWLGVVVLDASLVAEIAVGYDAVVMGADKWAQVDRSRVVRRRPRGAGRSGGSAATCRRGAPRGARRSAGAAARGARPHR